MNAFRFAAPVAMAIAVLAPLPGAAADRTVDVYDNYFAPQTVVAGTGDTVEWQSTCWYGGCAGAHNVTAYAGASFASPGNLGYPGSFSVTLTSDDPVFYRCTNHSTLIDGECDGMCGAISNNADVSPPSASVTYPAPDEVIVIGGITDRVAVGGSASDNVAVAALELRLYDLIGTERLYPAACSGCPGADVAWEALPELAPGLYTAEARAFDTAGNTRSSARVRFIVV